MGKRNFQRIQMNSGCQNRVFKGRKKLVAKAVWSKDTEMRNYKHKIARAGKVKQVLVPSSKRNNNETRPKQPPTANSKKRNRNLNLNATTTFPPRILTTKAQDRQRQISSRWSVISRPQQSKHSDTWSATPAHCCLQFIDTVCGRSVGRVEQIGSAAAQGRTHPAGSVFKLLPARCPALYCAPVQSTDPTTWERRTTAKVRIAAKELKTTRHASANWDQKWRYFKYQHI